MKQRFSKLADWFDQRTGVRTLRHHLLDEPIPGGTGWWFTTGSVVLFLLGVPIFLMLLRRFEGARIGP